MSVRVGRRGCTGCLAFVLLGCSGGGDAGSCGRVSPCGGDVQGNWTAGGACFDEAGLLSAITQTLGISCPAGAALAITSSDAQRAVSASFAADGSYSGTSSWSGSIDFQVPASCIEGVTCGDLAMALGGFVDPANGVVGATCTGTAACACSLVSGGTSSETGTYTTSGSMLQTTTSAGQVNETPYCVAGSLLHLISLRGGAIQSDVLLVRQ